MIDLKMEVFCSSIFLIIVRSIGDLGTIEDISTA
jgi:hypothetical protein